MLRALTSPIAFLARRHSVLGRHLCACSAANAKVDQLLDQLRANPTLLKSAAAKDPELIRTSLDLQLSPLEAMREADVNGDSIITEEEFQTWYRRRGFMNMVDQSSETELENLKDAQNSETAPGDSKDIQHSEAEHENQRTTSAARRSRFCSCRPR